jgi:hypothetical protein
MRKPFLKATAAVAAFAAIAGVAPLSPTASALPPGTPAAGIVNLTPSSGTSSTTFGMSFPSAQFCPGDATANYRWGTYITPISVDPATLTFTASGIPQGPAPTQNLRTSGGVQIRAQNPGLGDGIVIAPIDVSFSNVVFGTSATTITPGEYNIGIACTLAVDPDGAGPLPAVVENQRFWNNQITITAGGGVNNFSYVVGLAQDAPVLSLGAGTGTEQTINIDNPDASLSSYALSVVPAPANPLPTVAPGATSFQLTGLTIGQSYDVILTANKAGFPGVPSSTLTFDASATGPAPIVDAPDVFESTDATVSWTIPTVAGIPAPVSYDVTVTGGTAVTPFLGVAGTSVTIPAAELGLGSYTVTVTPNYAAGSGVTGTPGVDSFNVNPNALLFQEISVTRPPGVLILTQRCGVYGPLDEFVAVDAFPGFPRTLAAETASADQVGTSPDIDLATPGVQDDPEFGNYPLPIPATYPTECGLDMGTARFVTSGNLAGQFYTADGRLNQVTVLDTRDTDTGWIARGFVEDFSSGADTFDGSYLGWTPQVTDDSDPVGGSTYDQVVTPGPQVLPGTDPGLTVNSILGESLANEGLGIATMDARMKLLIPASADAGDYAATLSLSVIPRP